MNFKLFSLLLFFGLVLFACDKEDLCETEDITYTNTIASILNSTCALSGCHVDGNEANAFFSFEGYTKAKGAADFGRIVGAINHEVDYSPMPKNGDKLDQCTIDQITAWVDAGAPE